MRKCINRLGGSFVLIAFMASGPGYGAQHITADPAELDQLVAASTASDLRTVRTLRQSFPKDPLVAHAHAVIAWRNGSVQEAASAIDAAVTLGHPRRPDFVYNRALADVSRVTGVPRAISELVRFFSDDPEFLNEDFIDLLGYAVSRISDPRSKVAADGKAILDQRVSSLVSLQSAEDPRGPRVKWGSSWILPSEHAAHVRRNAQIDNDLSALENKDRRLEGELAELNARLNASNDSGTRAYLRGEIARLRTERTTVQKRIRDLEQARPKPSWAMGSMKWGTVQSRPQWDRDARGRDMPARIHGATLSVGMTEAEVAAAIGIDPDSVTVGPSGTVKTYSLPDRIISVTFQNGLVTAFSENRRR